MKGLIYTKLLILFGLLLLTIVAACMPRSPTYSPSKNTMVRPDNAPAALPPQPIAIAELPFKRPCTNNPLIIIDAGHGGEDFGTHSLGTTKYQEKYLNLSTAQMLKSYLEQFGYMIAMTRSDDTFVSLPDRALFANEKKPALFVSVHYNSAPNTDAEGIEVFFYKSEENLLRTKKSKQLAQSVLDRTIQNTKAKSRGVKHGNYAVLRETKMPAILIEGGFLTNTKEMEKIKNASYLKLIALGIAKGVQDYLAKEPLLADCTR